MRNATGGLRSVLLIGGSSEIGGAIAAQLVRTRGAELVVLAGRPSDALDEAANMLRGAGAKVESLELDVLAFGTHEAFVDRVFEQFGDMDVVVYAAGVLGDQQRSERDAAYSRHVVDSIFTGAVSLMVPLSGKLYTQGHGTLIVLSSIAGLQARRANYTYGAAKAGLDTYALGLGDSLAGSGVRVLVVRPGFVTTRMTAHLQTPPVVTTPAVVAAAVSRALDVPSKYVVYAPGRMRLLGWILRTMPRPLLRRLRY